jgi:hypothetical protein
VLRTGPSAAGKGEIVAAIPEPSGAGRVGLAGGRQAIAGCITSTIVCWQHKRLRARHGRCLLGLWAGLRPLWELGKTLFPTPLERTLRALLAGRKRPLAALQAT